MKQACKYNIIRFQPYPERQEFVNIGIVLCAPKSCDFTYRLLNKNQYSRVINFFKNLDEAILLDTMTLIDCQLKHVKSLIFTSPFYKESLYNNLVQLRQDIVYYGEHSVCFTVNPQVTCNELFEQRVV